MSLKTPLIALGAAFLGFLAGGVGATASEEKKRAEIVAELEALKAGASQARAAAPSVIFDASGEVSPVVRKILDDCTLTHRMAHAENLACVQQGFGAAAVAAGLDGHSFYDRIREECAGDEACEIANAGAFHVLRTMSPTIPGPRL